MRIKTIHPFVYVPKEMYAAGKITFEPDGTGTYQASVPDDVGEKLVGQAIAVGRPYEFERMEGVEGQESPQPEQQSEQPEQPEQPQPEQEEELVDEPEEHVEGEPPPHRRGRRGRGSMR